MCLSHKSIARSGRKLDNYHRYWSFSHVYLCVMEFMESNQILSVYLFALFHKGLVCISVRVCVCEVQLLKFYLAQLLLHTHSHINMYYIH